MKMESLAKSLICGTMQAMEIQEVLLSFPNHSFRMFQESLVPDTAMCSAPGAPATRAASTTLVKDAAVHHL